MLQQTFAAHVKPYAVWDAEQCRTQEPALRESRVDIAGGIWWEDNESGDCNMFTAQLADTCRRRYGVTFLFDTDVSLLLRDRSNPRRVRSVLTDEGREIEVDQVVVCMGSYTPLLLRRSLDLWLPIFPVKGYSLTLHPDKSAAPAAAPSLNIADIESKTYIARLSGGLGDRLRVVGMGELCGYDQSVDTYREGLDNLTAAVGQLFPPLHHEATREASRWACLRPMTPYAKPSCVLPWCRLLAR
jgi:D-amino-acid dehydrogenase